MDWRIEASPCATLFFDCVFMMYSFEPLLSVLACFVVSVCCFVFAVAFLPGRGSHSWLGRVRSSSPALIGCDAKFGNGLVLFVQ